MNVLLSRWQFGVTITYHFLFVPLTIGLAFLVAVMQVLAYRRRDQTWERLSRFFGTLFLINFAMGVVTGIVQEFQFGMNWSSYSVFVGNIFGAPLAMEGLLAFFAESTFIGVWLFGRNRLSPLVHTMLAPWGHAVSGGELQRISVARAVLADRPVLLLDEPTGHLDPPTADAVLRTVLEHAADRSLLWVTHRPAELVPFPEVRVLGRKEPTGR
jgi:hypothetical protein